MIRWLDGEKTPVPNIGDGESPLSTGLENIEKIYDKCLQIFHLVKQSKYGDNPFHMGKINDLYN